MGIFAPTFALSHFPKTHETPTTFFEKNKIFDFFTKFLFVPFTIIYFVILYAYSIKVLANFSEWPKGIIASIVMGFSVLGYFTYILSRNSENIIIKNFRKFLPFAVLPQVFMLFYAIFLRINQYGLTTNRYIIVLIGIILLGLSLYFIFSRKKKLIAIPLAFSIFAIIFSFGPWGIQKLPLQNQISSLEKILTHSRNLDDKGNIVASDYQFFEEEL